MPPAPPLPAAGGRPGGPPGPGVPHSLAPWAEQPSSVRRLGSATRPAARAAEGWRGGQAKTAEAVGEASSPNASPSTAGRGGVGGSGSAAGSGWLLPRAGSAGCVTGGPGSAGRAARARLTAGSWAGERRGSTAGRSAADTAGVPLHGGGSFLGQRRAPAGARRFSAADAILSQARGGVPAGPAPRRREVSEGLDSYRMCEGRGRDGGGSGAALEDGDGRWARENSRLGRQRTHTPLVLPDATDSEVANGPADSPTAVSSSAIASRASSSASRTRRQGSATGSSINGDLLEATPHRAINLRRASEIGDSDKVGATAHHYPQSVSSCTTESVDGGPASAFKVFRAQAAPALCGNQGCCTPLSSTAGDRDFGLSENENVNSLSVREAALPVPAVLASGLGLDQRAADSNSRRNAKLEPAEDNSALLWTGAKAVLPRIRTLVQPSAGLSSGTESSVRRPEGLPPLHPKSGQDRLRQSRRQLDVVDVDIANLQTAIQDSGEESWPKLKENHAEPDPNHFLKARLHMDQGNALSKLKHRERDSQQESRSGFQVISIRDHRCKGPAEWQARDVANIEDPEIVLRCAARTRLGQWWTQSFEDDSNSK